MNFFKKNFGLILALFLSIFSVLPLFHPGFFSMHDDTQVARVFEMGKSLKDGMFPVRWVSDLGYGYGYPIFNFYSPLPYYIGGFLTLFGFDALIATKLVFLIGILISGVSMYFLIKNFFGEIPSVVSSVIYVYFPYHAINIYIRGDLDEFYAYAFLPLVFLGFYKLFKNDNFSFRKNFNWIILTGAFLALVALSHNLTFFMLIIFLVFLASFSLIFAKKRLNLMMLYTIVLAVGFTLSAFYTLPAFTEMKYTNVFSQVGGGADYKDHFVCLNQFWDGPWGFGGSVRGCIDGMSFKLGKTNIIFSLISFGLFLYLFVKKKMRENIFLYLTSLIFLLFSIFMMTSYSQFVWDSIPEMGFVQYPWRFLNFTGLFLSILIGEFIFEIKQRFDKRVMLFIAIFSVLLTIVYNAKLFKPQEYYSRESAFYTDKQYINWTVSKISDEYMPKDFNKPKEQSGISNDQIKIVSGVGSVESVDAKTGFLNAKVNLEKSSLLKLNIAYFPSWKIFIDGKLTNFKVGKDGIYFNVPSGSKIVQAKFVQSPLEMISNVISFVGIIGIFAGIIWSKRYRIYGKKAS